MIRLVYSHRLFWRWSSLPSIDWYILFASILFGYTTPSAWKFLVLKVMSFIQHYLSRNDWFTIGFKVQIDLPGLNILCNIRLLSRRLKDRCILLREITQARPYHIIHYQKALLSRFGTIFSLSSSASVLNILCDCGLFLFVSAIFPSALNVIPLLFSVKTLLLSKTSALSLLTSIFGLGLLSIETKGFV